MSTIERVPNGAFNWLELATTDQSAGKAFYATLFGWSYEDVPMAPGDVYTMCRLSGRDVGAICTMRPEQRVQGVPPHWLAYIATDQIDAAAARVPALGGAVVAPPFDVMDIGRMSVIQDPTGATLAMWQARQRSGFGVTGIDGTLCWADLSTNDPERAARFYTELLGWHIEPGDEEPAHQYLHIRNGAEFIGGIPPVSYRDPHQPAYWLPYFAVADCDASAAQAARLGAATYMPPTAIEDLGRFAILSDLQGATFALAQVALH